MNTGKKILEKQGYRFTGDHSSVKICGWTKNSILNKGNCYKHKFYGINTNQCVQMTPSMVCPNRCVFCWRSLDYYTAEGMDSIDDPKKIIDNSLAAQKGLLSGLGGNKDRDKEKYKESQSPRHFAISLTGEPTAYPKLNKLLVELHKRKFTSFLVTNGMFPEALEKLTELPTQLYLSLDAPSEESYKEIDQPILKDYWKRFNRSLEIFSKMKTRRVIRITAVDGINMFDEEGYAELIKKANPDWVEVKSYSWVGDSRYRLKEENVPSFERCMSFAEDIGKLIGMKIIDTHERSRAVLLAKEDTPDRKLKF
ncbi:4-demethylwyosine synthase TYW1 [archaeon]|jgi:tRNA wybutosine-synthesizing protein 1|nr:4-demethylwyosine synthase TYW1 [archaeon]MBT6823858.1 4-demethylwyosine synthase TYW1 [archaeon]MBT7107388.1 4-demethylwyosine synthase TYW1 [archaeon]MBT7297217.1 4-demethylwyosine synthase TYW1 [archaeon]